MSELIQTIAEATGLTPGQAKGALFVSTPVWVMTFVMVTNQVSKLIQSSAVFVRARRSGSNGRVVPSAQGQTPFECAATRFHERLAGKVEEFTSSHVIIGVKQDEHGRTLRHMANDVEDIRRLAYKAYNGGQVEPPRRETE